MSPFLPKEIDYIKGDIFNEDSSLKKLMLRTLNSNLNNQIELHPLTKQLFNLETFYEIGDKLAHKDYHNNLKIKLFNKYYRKIKSLNYWFKFIDK